MKYSEHELEVKYGRGIVKTGGESVKLWHFLVITALHRKNIVCMMKENSGDNNHGKEI